ncbi:UPF0472 protein C16orf72 -like protein [Halotydeus destructor]|nr:UPF0472 protein C16orf72 -like protein [Halotydeus destructor]
MDDLDIDEPENGTQALENVWASPNYSAWEEECLRSMEDTNELEDQFDSERHHSNHKLWLSFQSAACCIAQLYKDRHQGVSLWGPFQNAADSVTSLYKDCLESQKRNSELGIQVGTHRRNKEILTWLKKRKRNIRRDELIAFLCGKPSKSFHGHRSSSSSWNLSPNRQWHSTVSDVSGPQSSSSSASSIGHRAHPSHNMNLTCLSLADPPNITSVDQNGEDLQTFRDALSAVAGCRNSPQSGLSSPLPTAFRRNSSGRNSNNPTNPAMAELNAFITEEFIRHVESKKRSAPSTDVIMGSPTHKKPKYL